MKKQLITVSIAALSVTVISIVFGAHQQVASQQEHLTQTSKLPASKSAWSILILNRNFSPSKQKEFEEAKFLERPFYKNTANDAKWQTIWSDGTEIRSIPNAVIYDSGKLLELETKTIKKTRKLKDKYHIDYTVKQLWERPIGGGNNAELEGRHLLRAAEQFFNDASPQIDDSTPTLAADFDGSIHLLSVYNNYISTEESSYANEAGTAHPSLESAWHTRKLGTSELAKASPIVPQSVLSKALKIQSQRAGEEGPPLESMELGGYALTPSGGTATAEVGIKIVYGAHNDVQAAVPIKLATAIPKESETLRNNFVNSHKDLLPWSKLSFYTISPDKECVVYATGGKLYWQGLGNSVMQLASIDEVRGVQWVDNRRLAQSDRNALLRAKH